jgi:hypothetical protein
MFFSLCKSHNKKKFATVKINMIANEASQMIISKSEINGFHNVILRLSPFAMAFDCACSLLEYS